MANASKLKLAVVSAIFFLTTMSELIAAEDRWYVDSGLRRSTTLILEKRDEDNFPTFNAYCENSVLDSLTIDFSKEDLPEGSDEIRINNGLRSTKLIGDVSARGKNEHIFSAQKVTMEHELWLILKSAKLLTVHTAHKQYIWPVENIKSAISKFMRC